MKHAYFQDLGKQPTFTDQHARPSKKLRTVARHHYNGPELTLDLTLLDQQVAQFKQALPQVTPHFAVKANPLPELLLHLKNLGVGFEIASLGELKLMQTLNVPACDLIFSNPIKTPASIISAVTYGVKWFSFDCKEELDKLQALAPGAHYELRMATNGKGAVWPLSTKFGMDISEAKALIDYAAQQQMNVAGLTFHVGSQCLRAQSWVEAIEQCQLLFIHMKKRGLNPKLLNLGGGFPCAISKMATSLTSMMKPVHTALASLSKDIELVAEPGRFLVAAAGTLTCQIINTTQRHNQHWAYLDCGYYNGLMELKENFGYELKSRREGPLSPWIIAGPTCDSLDMFEQPFLLPANSQAGDIIDIPNLGAYANTCATHFNGFDIPTIKIIT